MTASRPHVKRQRPPSCRRDASAAPPIDRRLDGVAARRSAQLPGDRDWATGETLADRWSRRCNSASPRSTAASAPARARFGQGLLLVLLVIGVLFLVIEAVALVAGLALARSITGSVHELFAGTERVRQGDFTHKIAIRARDQLGELAESFNSMTASIEDLLRSAAEKKRLEEELRIAHEIQMSLLPQGPLGMPGAVGDRRCACRRARSAATTTTSCRSTTIASAC